MILFNVKSRTPVGSKILPHCVTRVRAGAIDCAHTSAGMDPHDS